MKQHWEYRILWFPPGGPMSEQDFLSWLHEMDQEGWELVTQLQWVSYPYIFRRAVA